MVSLYFDGWYTMLPDAGAVAGYLETHTEAEVIGIVEQHREDHPGFGVLYWSEEEIFSNHVIEPMTNPSIVRRTEQ